MLLCPEHSTDIPIHGKPVVGSKPVLGLWGIPLFAICPVPVGREMNSNGGLAKGQLEVRVKLRKLTRAGTALRDQQQYRAITVPQPERLARI
jgi:hypothetical protein